MRLFFAVHFGAHFVDVRQSPVYAAGFLRGFFALFGGFAGPPRHILGVFSCFLGVFLRAGGVVGGRL